jgi:hypothetical protein
MAALTASVAAKPKRARKVKATEAKPKRDRKPKVAPAPTATSVPVVPAIVVTETTPPQRSVSPYEVPMPTEEPTTYMTTREAAVLADNLSQFGGKSSVATRVATMERHCQASVPAHPGDAAAGPQQRRVPAAAGRMIALGRRSQRRPFSA